MNTIHDAANINFSKRFRLGRIVEKYKPGITEENKIKIPNVEFVDISNYPSDYFLNIHKSIIDQKLVGYISATNLSINGNFTFTITWEDETETTISWLDDTSELDKILFYEKFVKLDAKNILNYITQYAIRKNLNRQVPLPYRKELIPKKKKVVMTKKKKEQRRQDRLARRAEKKAALAQQQEQKS